MWSFIRAPSRISDTQKGKPIGQKNWFVHNKRPGDSTVLLKAVDDNEWIWPGASQRWNKNEEALTAACCGYRTPKTSPVRNWIQVAAGLQYKREAAFNEHGSYRGSDPWLKGASGETGYGSTASRAPNPLETLLLGSSALSREGLRWWKGQTNKPSFSVDTEKGTPREIYARRLLSVSKNSTTAQW